MKTRISVLLASALLTFAAGVSAATFNLFSPAAGILKGNPSTYVTTAATAVDIISTFSGTCNSGTFLRGDGSCAAPGGGVPGGANTQVQYNNAGAFAGDAGLTYNSGTDTLTVGTLVLVPNLSVSGVDQTIGPLSSNSLIFQTNTSPRVTVTDAYTNVTQDDIDHTGAAGNWRFHQDASNWSIDQCDSLNSTCASKLTFSSTGNDTILGSGGDTLLVSGSGSIDMMAGNIDLTTPSGFVRVNINGEGVKNICLEDGTNCPAAGGDATLAGNQTFTGINAFSNASNTFTGAFTGNGSALTNLDAGDISTGTLPVARGGTGTTTSTGTGSVVLSASPTLTGTTTAATIAATAVTVGGNNVCQSTGTNCPTGGAQVAFATISVSAGVSCSINSSYDSANISGCTWLSAGAYNLDLSIGAGTFPTCSVTPFNAAGYIARAGNVDANTVSAGTYFLTDGDPVTWTASDVAFTIVCYSTG